MQLLCLLVNGIGEVNNAVYCGLNAATGGHRLCKTENNHGFNVRTYDRMVQ